MSRNKQKDKNEKTLVESNNLVLENNDDKDSKKNRFIKIITTHKEMLNAVLVIPILLFLAFEVFYKLANVLYARILWAPGIIFSLLLFIGIYMAIYAIVNNSYRASVICSVLLVIFGVSNQVKIALSDDPLFLTDILFINSASTFKDILKGTISELFIKYIFVIIPFIVSLVCICKFAKKYNTYKLNIPKRLISFIVPIGLMVFISLPIYNVNHAVLVTFFNINNRQDKYATTNMGYYFKFGVFGGLYGQMVENRLVEPKNYDVDKLNQLLKDSTNKTSTPQKDLGTPNIVMIFSESFWNIDDLKEVKFDKPVASNFENLKNEGILIDMLSPSYGGISSNVEYEMLTGSSIKFYTPGYIPYMQLYRDDKYYNAPSVIQELKKNGYTTHISSTWESTLFNCEKVYDYFGVDKVDYSKNMKDAKYKGGRISDEYIGNRIINELKNKKKGEKLFTMTLTAQAHMPFLKDKYKKYDIKITDSKLSKEENDTVLSYAQGVYDADKQLKMVYDYIQTMDEPTILIFYGDHLPYLKTASGKDTTVDLKYFNSGDKLQDLYNRYHTQCLILSNYDLGEDNIGYMGPDLVMTYLMNNMNMELDPYYKWLYTTIDDLPVSNLYVSVDQNGNKYFTDKLTGKMKEQYELRKQMNWKLFVDVENQNVK